MWASTYVYDNSSAKRQDWFPKEIFWQQYLRALMCWQPIITRCPSVHPARITVCRYLDDVVVCVCVDGHRRSSSRGRDPLNQYDYSAVKSRRSYFFLCSRYVFKWIIIIQTRIVITIFRCLSDKFKSFGKSFSQIFMLLTSVIGGIFFIRLCLTSTKLYVANKEIILYITAESSRPALLIYELNQTKLTILYTSTRTN